jgi:hypothetical protein
VLTVTPFGDVGDQAIQAAVCAQSEETSGRVGDAGLALVGKVEIALGREVQVVTALEAFAVCRLEYRFELP